MSRARRWPLLALLILAAGCSGTAGSNPGRSASDAPAEARPGLGDRLTGSQMETLRQRYPGWDTDFSRHAVPLSEFADGGPPRDGIPPIDHPEAGSLASGDRFLSGPEPVIAVEVNGEARAYPEQILVWHEIVNDTLGGRPIAVTYCPLCNSAVVFDRRVGRRALTFGTTGKLRNSDLVMWDRQTQSWWQQFSGTALVGRYAGTQLQPLESQVLSWAQFKAAYPRGDVLLRPAGFDRPYGTNPYVGYETDTRNRPTLYRGRLDPRLPPLERVAAVFAGRDVVVVPFSIFARRPIVIGSIAGQPLVVLYARGVASALDGETIARSRDVGTAGAFDPRVRGETLSFVTASADRFRDRQTGSIWDVTGRAVSGPLAGARMRALRHDEQFWFALAAFLPHARLLTGSS
jgi:hypothetical protein